MQQYYDSKPHSRTVRRQVVVNVHRMVYANSAFGSALPAFPNPACAPAFLEQLPALMCVHIRCSSLVLHADMRG